MASILVAGYFFVGAGYALAVAIVPGDHQLLRAGVVAVALGGYAVWARHAAGVACFTVIAWLAASARLTDENGELALESSLPTLAVLAVAAAAGLLLARLLPR